MIGVDFRATHTSGLAARIARIETLAPMLVAKAAADVEREAKVRAPVDTGYLRNSIQATRTDELSWVVNVGADYGLFVEWGTSRMGARPFLHPAANAVRPQFMAAMRQAVAA